MTALIITWLSLMSLFIQDSTTFPTSEIESFHVSPRDFTPEPSIQVLENDGYAHLTKIKQQET